MSDQGYKKILPAIGSTQVHNFIDYRGCPLIQNQENIKLQTGLTGLIGNKKNQCGYRNPLIISYTLYIQK